MCYEINDKKKLQGRTKTLDMRDRSTHSTAAGQC